jgi:hypothetical protein
VTQRPMLLHATEPGQALKHSVGSLASGFIALDSGGDVGLRAALALTLLGPPAVAVGAPIASWLNLRARHRKLRAAGGPAVHPVGSIVAALLAWCGLSTGVAVFLQYLGFAYAWMGAHPPAASPASPEAPWFAIVVGLSLMGGVALVLHRFVARRYHTRAVR